MLRLVHLNSDLWLDEIGTLVSYLRLPVTEIVRTYLSMNQHLLYSVLARLSVVCFGESAWAIRLPAALFGIGAIPALYFMARQITSEREALLASALLAFSYHHIWFSQDARGYSAMVFFSLLGTGFLIRALVGRGKWQWVGYTVAMTLGVVSLQNTFFLAAGQLLCCLLLIAFGHQDRKAFPLRELALSAVSIVLLSLLGHSLVLGQMLRFMRQADRVALGWTNIRELMPVITSGLVAGLGLMGIAGLIMLGAAGWYSYWKQTKLISGFLIVPVILNAALLMVLHIGAYPRSFLYELPFALLIAVRGGTWWSGRLRLPERTPVFACGLLLLIASLPLVKYYRLPKQDFTGALAYVQAHKNPGDVVMAADLAGVCYRRYYYPEISIAASGAEVEAVRHSGRTAWMLYSFPREFRLRSPELFRFIRTRMDHIAVFPGTLGGGDVYLAKTTTDSQRQ